MRSFPVIQIALACALPRPAIRGVKALRRGTFLLEHERSDVHFARAILVLFAHVMAQRNSMLTGKEDTRAIPWAPPQGRWGALVCRRGGGSLVFPDVWNEKQGAYFVAAQCKLLAGTNAIQGMVAPASTIPGFSVAGSAHPLGTRPKQPGSGSVSPRFLPRTLEVLE